VLDNVFKKYKLQLYLYSRQTRKGPKLTVYYFPTWEVMFPKIYRIFVENSMSPHPNKEHTSRQ
jgi:hypothetical protein